MAKKAAKPSAKTADKEMKAAEGPVKSAEEKVQDTGSGPKDTGADTGDTSGSETEDMWDTISDLEGDPDYHAWVRDVWQPLLAGKHTGVTQEGVYVQWRDQDGLCAATGIPLVGVQGGKGMYSPELVTSGARQVHVVASYVAAMYGSLARYGVSWGQFLRLVSLVDDE